MMGREAFLVVLVLVTLASVEGLLKLQTRTRSFLFELTEGVSNFRPIYKTGDNIYLFHIEFPVTNGRWMVGPEVGEPSGFAYMDSWAVTPYFAPEVSNRYRWVSLFQDQWSVDDSASIEQLSDDNSIFIRGSDLSIEACGLYIELGTVSGDHHVYINPFYGNFLFHITKGGLNRFLIGPKIGSLEALGFVDVEGQVGPYDLSRRDVSSQFQWMVPSSDGWRSDPSVQVIPRVGSGSIFSTIRSILNVNVAESEQFSMSNQLRFPSLGFGTGGLPSPQPMESSVRTALVAGYKLLDLAVAYNNEELVGSILQDRIVPREEVFVITKMWPDNFGFSETLADVKRSLLRLRTYYINNYMIHWPTCTQSDWMDCSKATKFNWLNSYRALERAYAEGVILSIGISNFDSNLLEIALDQQVKPHLLQNYFSMEHQEWDILKMCQSNGVVYQSYATLRGAALGYQNEVVSQAQMIGRNYQKDAFGTILRFMLQNGIAVIPRSSTEKHIRENLLATKWSLSLSDMQTLRMGPVSGQQNFDEQRLKEEESRKKEAEKEREEEKERMLEETRKRFLQEEELKKAREKEVNKKIEQEKNFDDKKIANRAVGNQDIGSREDHTASFSSILNDVGFGTSAFGTYHKMILENPVVSLISVAGFLLLLAVLLRGACFQRNAMSSPSQVRSGVAKLPQKKF